MEREHIFDIKNTERKIIAEIESRESTVYGRKKKVIQIKLKSSLKFFEYKDYLTSYIKIISSTGSVQNKPFIQADNILRSRHLINKFIKIMNRYLFYNYMIVEFNYYYY